MIEKQTVTEEFRQKQIWAVRFRGGILLGLAFIYLGLVNLGGVPFSALPLLALLPLFLLNEARRLCHSRGIHNDLLTELSIVADVVTIGVIVYFTGGVESFFLPFLMVQVAGTALHVNFKAGLKTAAGAAVMVGLLAWLEYSATLPHSLFMDPAGHGIHCLDATYALSAAVMTAFGVFLASLSSGYVAKRLRIREEELAEANRQLVRLYRETQRLSITDELTGAFNRRYLSERLAEELGRSARYERPLSVLLLDVDFFKKVNDTHGHAAGDAVLQQVAARVSRVLRDVDFLARYGGEEFVVVLPETGLDGARLVAERIRARIGREAMVADTAAAASIRVTVSVGVASHQELAPGAPEAAALLELADARLYRAKESGRNRVVSTDSVAPLSTQDRPDSSFAGRPSLAHA